MKADFLIRNARIRTLDDRGIPSESLAALNGRVLAIGSSQDLEPLVGPNTCVLDLDNRTVLPGFIDAHEHLSWFAEEPLKVNVSPGQVRSLAELLKRVNGEAAKLAPGKWIQAVLYDDTKMVEGRRLTRDDLDQAAPENPVIVVHVSGHWAVVNSAAMESGGLTDQSPDPKGGTLGRDPNTGRLDGRLIEMAMFNFAFESLAVQPTVVPPFPREVRRNSLKQQPASLIPQGSAASAMPSRRRAMSRPTTICCLPASSP